MEQKLDYDPDDWKSVQEARAYMLRTRRWTWTGVWMRELARRKVIEGYQAGDGKTAPWRISLSSIDARFPPARSGSKTPPKTS